MHVGLVGLGRMGLSMARTLIKAGHLVLAYDVSPHAKTEAERAGVEPAASVSEVGGRSGVVFLSLPDTEVARSVVAGPDGLIPSMAGGGTIIDTSTIAPSAARAMAADAARRGLAYLDAPVSGSIPWAESGRLTIMVGGKEEAYNEHLPLLECIGEHVFYVGESGSGQNLKLCHQLIFYTTTVAICEALALGDRLGFERETMLEVISRCAAPAHVLEFMGPDLIERNYENVMGDINLGSKDLSLVMGLAREADFSSVLGAAVGGLYRTAVEKGYGGRSLIAFSEEELLARVIQ